MSSKVQAQNDWVTIGESKKTQSTPPVLSPNELAKKIEDRRQRRARYKEAKKLRKEEEKRLAMFAPKDSKVRVVKTLYPTQRKTSEEKSSQPIWKLETEAFPDLKNDNNFSYANAIKKKPETVEVSIIESSEPSLSTKKKIGQPISFNMEPVVKVKQSKLKKMKITSSKIIKTTLTSRSKNTLDASTPVHLGKNQKARLKKKRPGKLKRIILKEKLLRKALRETSLSNDVPKSEPQTPVIIEEDSKNKVALSESKSKAPNPPKALHSKKFRSYCTHLLDKNLDEYVSNMMKDIIRWQDRAHADNPIRAKANRRYVIGLREAKKWVTLSSVKLLVIASDLEPIKSEGGLDDTIEEIKKLCKEKGVPVVYSHTRWKLGYITYRKNPLACIGVINYQGSDENFKKIMELLPVLTENYNKKRSELEMFEAKTMDGGVEKAPSVNEDPDVNTLSSKMIQLLKP